MTRIFAALLALLPQAAPSWAGGDEAGLPLGMRTARILPGWLAEDGSRIAALELQLAPGWKTYWRSPGDSGFPPSFEWEGSRNLAGVSFHWPAPQAIRSGGAQELGYEGRLILPFTALPAQPGLPVDLALQADLGLCETICVPAHLQLAAPQAGAAPDPRILDALAQAPVPLEAQPGCSIDEIADGLRVRMTLPEGSADLAAIEVAGRDDLWISGATIEDGAGGRIATAELVGPEAAPFPLDAQTLRLTAVGPGGAVEMTGCRLGI